MKKTLLLFLMVMLTITVSAQKQKKNEFNYEVVSAGVATEGTELIKVYSYAKNQNKAIEIGKMNAVHAILFKGVPGSSGNYIKPAMVKPEQKEANQEFFDNFFKSGQYLQYVTLSSDGVIDPRDMLHVGNQYKIGIIFAVSKTALRQYLEDQGIITSLGSMF